MLHDHGFRLLKMGYLLNQGQKNFQKYPFSKTDPTNEITVYNFIEGIDR